MTNRETMELFIEKNGQETVAYPFVEKDHVVFGNGMGIEEVIEQDISMPTVTHEEVSFKVGVGDQDVSSSVVDSSVGEMVIKGQTYHNILPEPSTHVLTNNKEMFKVNEGLDPNVEIVDGVSKSAILKGQTLVNIITKNSGTISRTSNNSRHNLHIPYHYKLTPNKKYYVTFKVSNITGDTTGRLSVSLCNGQLSNQDLEIKDGRYSIITTAQQSKEEHLNSLAIYFIANGTDTSCDISEIMVIEYQDGMENWDIPFFRGMQSVKLPVLTTYGKNLFDKNKLEEGELSHVTGEPTTSVGRCRTSKFIQVKGGSKVTLSKSTNEWFRVFGYDNNKNFVSDVINRKSSSETFAIPSNVCFIKIKFDYTLDIAMADNIQLEIRDKATAYEPYKSNILSTSEDVVLRGIGEVRDTLDCLTGELVQSVGEIVLDGSDDESWSLNNSSMVNTLVFHTNHFAINNKIIPICDKFIYSSVGVGENGDFEHYRSNGNFQFIFVNRSRLESNDVNGFKKWLSQNPITIQYALTENSVKTVDLSSSGNWEKIVFNGSENWNKFQIDSMLKHSQFYIRIEDKLAGSKVMCDSFTAGLRQTTDNGGEVVAGDGGNGKNVWVNILNSRLASLDVNGFKQYLQQNPMTVWYQTETHKDSTQVKQPIFFKDGHIQLSSGADNSLIPTLDYQAKTSNSYVMDLMKTNTKYTMKAKSASGTFTIDGTSYGAGTNGTFTTPSSMTNKFLVMSDKTHEEVMIIEGDVTDKTIPYFKGIKSAFEGEDKIEVLSTGKNWVNLDNARLNSNHQKVVTRIENGFNIKFTYMGENFTGWDNAIKIKVNVKPNTDYTVSLTKIVRKDPYGGMSPQPTWVTGYTWVRKGDSNNESFTERNLLDGTPTTMKFNSRDYDYVTLDICSTPSRPVQDGDFDIVDIQVEESSSATVYESYKSNSTKIPLLSSLRSLPDGTCDELIIDRTKKKATLIQRVGDIFVNGSEKWNNMEITTPTNYVLLADNRIKCGSDRHFNNVSSSFPVQSSYDRSKENCYVAHKNQLIFTPFTERFRNLQEFKQWLSQNPTTVYYQLATPVITEVDLEGFPYIYKDGHIFLNSEIAPTTQIIYSISQQHQISASTQDLIRHEQELVYLYKLIAQYIQVDYQSTLLSLDLKLK